MPSFSDAEVDPAAEAEAEAPPDVSNSDAVNFLFLGNITIAIAWTEGGEEVSLNSSPIQVSKVYSCSS